MARSELTKYKTLLETKLAQLTSASRKREDIVIQTTPELLDEVQLSAERELALHNLSRESRLAREVRAALARIDEASYGICLNCGEEIKPRRLDAVPWAAYCLRCQEAAERQGVELSEPIIDHLDGATPGATRPIESSHAEAA